MRTTYVTYEEAQTLVPILRYLARAAPYREARRSARAILAELEDVRFMDYAPLHGHQIVLKEREHDLLKRVMEEFL